MSAGIKVTNGDISFGSESPGQIDLIFDQEKAIQLAIHTISFNSRPDGKGAGLNELVGQANNPIFFRSILNNSIRSSFDRVISDQYNTPQVSKTRRELIDSISNLVVAPSADDPRDYDLEITVILLNGEENTITGILG